jgi:DNA-binding IclR family transcriptional regulator
MSDIQSIRRAFDILKAVGAHPDGATLTDIANQLHLPKSTVSRMLSTLAQAGAIEKLGGREGFRLGNELLALASNVPYPRNLAAIARPHLEQLAKITAETLTLCVPDGDTAHYIDQINSSRAIVMTDWRRQKLPVHATSDGKLFMTAWPDEAVARYMARPPQRFTLATIVDPAVMLRELKAIRKRGYAWTNGEYDDDIFGIAAPIHDHSGALVASVCVFGPRYRFPAEEHATGLIGQIIRTAKAISERLKGAHLTPS